MPIKKLSKIKKWADTNGYAVKEHAISRDYQITVSIHKNLSFTVSERESTVYSSIRGKKGNPKGVYLAINDTSNFGSGYHFQYPSQKAIIDEMDEVIVKKKTNVKIA